MFFARPVAHVVIQEASTTQQKPMAINLEKGQSLEIGLKKVGIQLSWDAAETGQEFDLDASAFMLGKNKKLPDDSLLVFYNNERSGDGAVESSGDDTSGDDDGETLTVDFSRVDNRVNEILIVVTIHDCEVRKQTFGQVRNSKIRIYDAINSEDICQYELDEDFSTETALEFGTLVRKGRSWEFEAIGSGFEGGLEYLVSKYG